MSDDKKRWMLFKVPGVGDLCAWIDPEVLATGAGLIQLENATRIVTHPGTGKIGGMKFGGESGVAPLNLSAVPTWMPAPDYMLEDLAALWSQIVKPTLSLLRE